jgi:hypothetical protein
VEHDLERDMMDCQWFKDKIRASTDYAQNIYAALCNMRWQPADVVPILKDEYWSCSWRSAGGIVANLCGKGDYMDWYCSGIGGGIMYDDGLQPGYVPEGVVTDEILADFKELGWAPSPWPKDKD